MWYTVYYISKSGKRKRHKIQADSAEDATRKFRYYHSELTYYQCIIDVGTYAKFIGADNIFNPEKVIFITSELAEKQRRK